MKKDFYGFSRNGEQQMWNLHPGAKATSECLDEVIQRRKEKQKIEERWKH